MKTVAQMMAQVEARIDAIIAAGRDELIRLAHEHQATEVEIALLLTEHDEMQREWREEELATLRAELIDMWRDAPTVH